jgi:hypothetical protein
MMFTMHVTNIYIDGKYMNLLPLEMHKHTDIFLQKKYVNKVEVSYKFLNLHPRGPSLITTL